MHYADKTMRSREPSPIPPLRSFLLMGAWGALIGALLLTAGAPFWVFCVAPLSMGPLLVHELRALDAGAGSPRNLSDRKKPLVD
jgi:hypothetical protein